MVLILVAMSAVCLVDEMVASLEYLMVDSKASKLVVGLVVLRVPSMEADSVG